MEPIVYGPSALEYHRTPPQVRNISLTIEQACAPPPEGAGLPRNMFLLRSNARAEERLVAAALLGPLKGITLPVHLMVDDSTSRRRSDLIVYHRMHAGVERSDAASIGCGLAVASPATALRHAARFHSRVRYALILLEACGIYSIFNETKRSSLAMQRLLDMGGTHRKLVFAQKPLRRVLLRLEGTRCPTKRKSSRPP